MLATMRAFLSRTGVALASALVVAPFLVTRAAAQGAGAGVGGSFLGLSLQNFTPYHAATGGLLLGVATAMSMLVKGDILGVSGVAGGIVKGKHNEVHRWMFLAGLMTGGFALKTLYPSGLGIAEMPMWRAVAGGLLVGVGVTLGNGCTSGHGICGNSRLSPRSMVYTLVFMASGFATGTVIRDLFVPSIVEFTMPCLCACNQLHSCKAKFEASHVPSAEHLQTCNVAQHPS